MPGVPQGEIKVTEASSEQKSNIPQKRQLALPQMLAGQTGTVVAVLGGHGFVRRLEAMGLRPGKKVTKISSAFLRGPVTFKVDHTQVAVGFGLAQRIVVEVETMLEDTARRKS